MMNYPNFKQKDPKWAKDKIGQTNLTMDRWGCAVACLADLCQFYGKDTTPVDLARKLMFTKKAEVYWSSLSELYPDILFRKYTQCLTTPAPIKYIDEKLTAGIPLIVETRINKKERLPHFVILWKKVYGLYIISDPLTDAYDFEKQYGKPARWIYKIAYYEGKKQNRVKELFEYLTNIIENAQRALKLTEQYNGNY